jgi:hypothetical protein
MPKNSDVPNVPSFKVPDVPNFDMPKVPTIEIPKMTFGYEYQVFTAEGDLEMANQPLYTIPEYSQDSISLNADENTGEYVVTYLETDADGNKYVLSTNLVVRNKQELYDNMFTMFVVFLLFTSFIVCGYLASKSMRENNKRFPLSEELPQTLKTGV